MPPHRSEPATDSLTRSVSEGVCLSGDVTDKMPRAGAPSGARGFNGLGACPKLLASFATGKFRSAARVNGLPVRHTPLLTLRVSQLSGGQDLFAPR